VLCRLLNPWDEQTLAFCSPLHDMVREKLVDLAHERLSLQEARHFLKATWDHLAASSASLRSSLRSEAEDAVRRALGALQQVNQYLQDPDLARLEAGSRMWSRALLDLERLWAEELSAGPTRLRALNVAVRGYGHTEGFRGWCRSLRVALLELACACMRAPAAEFEQLEELHQLFSQLAAPRVPLETLASRLEGLLAELALAGQPGLVGDEGLLAPLFFRLARQGDCTPLLSSEFRVLLERGQWVADQLLLEDVDVVDLSERLDGAIEHFHDWRRSTGATARGHLERLEGALSLSR